MKIEYEGVEYKVEQVTGNIYRAYNKDCGVVFDAELRHGGSYFMFRSAWVGDRTYSAWKYSTKWIPIMREATYMIAKTDGLYDYQNGGFYRLVHDNDRESEWRAV